MDFTKLNFIIEKFFINSKVLNIDVISSGIINKTYIIEHLYNGVRSKFILQCLSTIFESKERVNMNHNLITNHIKNKINNSYFNFYSKRWEVPNLIRCKSNNLFLFTLDSDSWRAMSYIDDTLSFDFLEDKAMAYQTGIGLAKFHMSCSDLDCSKLKKSIKNFHNTIYYIDQYNLKLKEYDFKELDFNVNIRIKHLINSLSHHVKYASCLVLSLNRKLKQKSIIHGDPKLSNFLFDIKYKYVVSLIDLDTVSLGYYLTDLADCIRSICNPAGEDPDNKENICFDINTCIVFLNGYFKINNKKIDYHFNLLPEFIYLIIFELTIRFLTDFLQSNRYFKIKYETHNLFRAEVQHQLLSSFLTQIPNFSKRLHEIGISSSSIFVSDVEKFV